MQRLFKSKGKISGALVYVKDETWVSQERVFLFEINETGKEGS
jgi:hypothetical protein